MDNNDVITGAMQIIETGDSATAITKEIERFLEAGLDVNARIPGFERSWTMLHRLCWQHDFPEAARLLLEKGADVNARDKEEDTPLHLACESISSDATSLLLEYGADVNARDFLDNTPLHIACRYGSLENVLALLEAGAEVNAKNMDGFSPAHDAVNNDNLLVALCLLEHGADPAELFDTVMRYHPEENIDDDDVLETNRGLRERIIDWYREHHPEALMEAYCTDNASQHTGMGL